MGRSTRELLLAAAVKKPPTQGEAQITDNSRSAFRLMTYPPILGAARIDERN